MKIKFLIVFLFATFVLASEKSGSPSESSRSSSGGPSSSDDDQTRPESPRRNAATLEEHMALLEVTPGSAGGRDYRADDGLRPITEFPTTRRSRLGNQDHAVYIITVGRADLTQLPIFELGNAFISQRAIDDLMNRIARELNRQQFFRYVGRTTLGVEHRAAGHTHATPMHPERRLPHAILEAREQGQEVRMHTLVRGIHPDQMPQIEGELIRALNANGDLGLNGNAGSPMTGERGARLTLDVTPNTRTPQTEHGRTILGQDLRPVPAGYAVPQLWMNIVYMITPDMETFQLPIVDLGGEELDEVGMQHLHDRFAAYTLNLPRRYIGLATEGAHQDRTPMRRAREHVYAGVTNPFRRLPLALAGVPAQMHVLVANIHPAQIHEIEALLIDAFQAMGPLGLNANAGHRQRLGQRRFRVEPPEADLLLRRAPPLMPPRLISRSLF